LHGGQLPVDVKVGVDVGVDVSAFRESRRAVVCGTAGAQLQLGVAKHDCLASRQTANGERDQTVAMEC
jgi:hypothetical protein